MVKLVLIFVAVINFHCWKRCDTYTTKRLTGLMEEYFGVYKEKNWWVYQNRPGTKKDSIFLSDFKDIILGEESKKACEKHQQRTFSVDGMFLADGHKLFGNYFTRGQNLTVLRLTSPSVFLPEFQHSSLDQKISALPIQFNGGSPFLDSISINGVKYYNILIGKESTSTYFFAKNTGLVGWMNVLDTFNLVNFKIF